MSYLPENKPAEGKIAAGFFARNTLRYVVRDPQSWMAGQDTSQETPYWGELAFLLAKNSDIAVE